MNSDAAIRNFRNTVWAHWKKSGRHDLPWRKTRNPYRILVSEVMLQQTQVSRVVDIYKAFLKQFPDIYALAEASLADVLRAWSGLGYNRRAKYLHDTVRKTVTEYDGNLKKALTHPLPGVGPYTRAAVRVFAFNEPHTMIETNIRSVYMHHFFPKSKTVSDRDLLTIIEKSAEGQDPREWHSALMDYGAFLKQSGVRINSRSVHYKKQSKFAGSQRQLRGTVLRELSKKGHPMSFFGRGKMTEALAGLERDGLIVETGGKWRIA